MRLFRSATAGGAARDCRVHRDSALFSALMASALALEKPRVVQRAAGQLKTTWHEPTSGTIATVWLWSRRRFC